MEFDRNLPIKERIYKRRRKKKMRFLAFIFIVIVCGVSTNFYINGNLNEAHPSERQQEKVRVIDDEKSTASSNIDSKKYEELKLSLSEYIKKYQGQYGIYFIDMADKNEFGINHDDIYTAASTVKIPLNLFLSEKIRDGDVDPEGTLTYLRQDYEEGTGKIQYKTIGDKYKIRELSRLSVELSDNVATNMIIRYLGMDGLKNYMRKSGGLIVSDTENISCPKDMALYMRKVYMFYKSEGVYGSELMEYFKNTEFNDRIPAMLPDNVVVAHKTGNQVRAVHDIGIVFTKKPYIISIMSKGVDENEANAVIANISRKVYDFVIANQ